METPRVSITFSLTLLLSTLVIIISPAHSELCNPNDKRVLLQIKQLFNNPLVLSSWKPDTDCCTRWHYVSCHHETNRISSVIISGGLSAGQIPAQLGDLTDLENLVLIKHPSLGGPIPPSIANLQNLNYLTISSTNLSGPVPQFLAQMQSLRSLDLSSNKLAGPIPQSLSQLPSLGSLHLDRNRLTGPIPDSFGEFPGEDFYLYLSHNQLSGKIPASLGRKKDFVTIDLSWNVLEGDASALFRMPSLERLDLSRNLLEFDLSKVGPLGRSLSWLDLNHNKIFGGIPLDLTELSLVMLNVSYNRLCGKIPSGGNLQSKFGVTEFFHNQCLCGAPLNNITCH